MNKNGFSRMNVFLVELIVVILAFALASAILLQVFVRADSLSRDASSLSSAVIAAECAAEQQLCMDFSQLKSSGDTAWYDVNWQPAASEQEAVFGVVVENEFRSQQAGTLVSFTVRAFDRLEQRGIYELQSAQYYAGQWKETVSDESKR